MQHPVELTFDHLRGVITGILEDLSGLQYEAVGRLDLRPRRLALLKRPAEVAVQQGEVWVSLLGPLFVP